jgi:predicted ATPase
MSDAIQVTVEELRLRNFRAFENARLTLSDLTFLVGRNGAGKSTLLDAFDLLREAVTAGLEIALDRRGGIDKVRRWTGRRGRKVPMAVVLVLRIRLPGGRTLPCAYGFEIRGDPARSDAITERLVVAGSAEGSFSREGAEVKGGRRLDASPPVGNLVLPLLARADQLWTAVLEALRNLRAYELSPAHMALAVDVGERSTLDRDGGNVGDVVKSLQGSPDHRWVVERLAAITPGLADVRASALMGKRVLQFTQHTAAGDQKLDATQVSQGTLRGLGVLLALRQEPTPSAILVDEVEDSFHPGALSVLLDAAAASLDRMRVVITSHSPELLGHPAVTGERVRVVEWRDGLSRLHRLNEQTRAAVNEIDTVGWMLSTNSLWTSPIPELAPDDIFLVEDARS